VTPLGRVWGCGFGDTNVLFIIKCVRLFARRVSHVFDPSYWVRHLTRHNGSDTCLTRHSGSGTGLTL
jgi:hypothetical protein